MWAEITFKRLIVITPTANAPIATAPHATAPIATAPLARLSTFTFRSVFLLLPRFLSDIPALIELLRRHRDTKNQTSG